MLDDSLPLFSWRPPSKTLLFPMERRVGRIRDVASKMLDKPTERSADHYRKQVTESLERQLALVGIHGAAQAGPINTFWSRVHDEMRRQSYRGSTGNNPRGAA